MAKKPPLGSGARFQHLVAQLSGQKGVTDPKALAATIGAAKYGRAKMQAMAAKGRKREPTQAMGPKGRRQSYRVGEDG